ncbi:MAG: hypothetical protein AB8B65_03460 [Kordia sp.]|uniref:hypothetical protein n=1 Tax=Kordia sp. TaxID=1965332 RepID=UPI00385BAC27
MKKSKLKNFALNKKTISKLDALNRKGGNPTNSEKVCVRTFVNAAGVNICCETQQKYCIVSVVIDCITQTEFPTCSDCV